MSRLAIQISVAAVFLTTVVSEPNNDPISTMNDPISAKIPKSNPQCSGWTCVNQTQHCRETLEYYRTSDESRLRKRICFDRIPPSGRYITTKGKHVHGSGEKKFQAYLTSCSSKDEPECKTCCKAKNYGGRVWDFIIDGEVDGDGSCLCTVILK